MQIAIKEFFDAFPGYGFPSAPPRRHAAAHPRQAGRGGHEQGHPERCRVLQERVRGLIRDVMREMKLASGEVTWKGEGNIWLSRDLPTFTGGPIQMTAAKTLVERRKLERMAGRRAVAG